MKAYFVVKYTPRGASARELHFSFLLFVALLSKHKEKRVDEGNIEICYPAILESFCLDAHGYICITYPFHPLT
jgi:hypothetical protein